MVDEIANADSSSQITIHENYFQRPNYEDSNASDPELSINSETNSTYDFQPQPNGIFLNQLQHRRSTVSLISNSITVNDFSPVGGATTALTLKNVQGDEVPPSPRTFEGTAASMLTSQTTPILRMFSSNEHPALEDRLSDNISNFTSNADDQQLDEEHIERILSPLLNDQNSINNTSTSGDQNSLLGFNLGADFLGYHQDTPIDLGLHLEKADNDSCKESFFAKKKHFFILSSAGKPIYSMHGSDDILTVYSGIIQTIVSFFQYNPDGDTEQLKSFVAGDNVEKVRFLFLNKSPIILMASSSLGESDIQLNQQLDFLYNFLLTTLSKPHIDKVFQRRENFDLRKLLGKADIACLDSICNDLANFNNPGLIIGGLECVKIRKSIRNKIEGMLLSNKSENLLYGLLVAPNGRLITVLRPRRHTLHTSDLQLLFSMIFNTNTFKSASKKDQDLEEGEQQRQQLTSNEEFWVPVCLPKFNPNGFLYSFIQFIDLKDERLMKLHDMNMDVLKNKNISDDSSKITIILISAYKDSFFEMRKIANNIIKSLKLERSIYRELFRSVVGTQGANGQTGLSSGKVSPIDIPAPLVKHFIFKSKKYTQFVFSRLQGQEVDEDKEVDKGQLMMIYSYLHSRMLFNNRSSGGSTNANSASRANNRVRSANNGKDNDFMESNFINQVKWKYAKDTLIGLLISTSNYEIYLINNGGIVDKSLLVKSCKNIIRWCRKNEERLFICGGAVF